MSKRMLLALQPGHDAAERVAAVVVWARRLSMPLDVCTVLDTHVPLDPMFAMGDDRAVDAPGLALDWLNGLLETVPEAMRGDARIWHGRPVPALVDASASYSVIAVGTHHRRELARLFLGSVAEGIVREARCAVLVLGENLPDDFDRPVRVRAPFDPSEPNPAAIDWVQAHLPDAAMKAVHTLTWMVVFGPTPESGHTIYENAMKTLRTGLEAVGHGDLAHFVLVREEMNVGDALAHEAVEMGAHLIALPTHGRTGIIRAVIGSVAERVVRASGVSVLVVR